MKPKRRGNVKIYKIYHESPFDGEFMSDFPVIFVPFSKYYGDLPKNAGRGDRVRFNNGDVAEILSLAEVELKKKSTEILFRLRYGCNVRLVFAAWERRYCALGGLKGSLNNETCYMLWHGPKI